MTNAHRIRPREPDSRLYEAVLIIAFFFSGATSLCLAVAWCKELTCLLGSEMMKKDYFPQDIVPGNRNLFLWLRDTTPVASPLQRIFPTFPEAYIAEDRAWAKKGERIKAQQALNRGWIYLPGNPKMVQWRRQFGMTG